MALKPLTEEEKQKLQDESLLREVDEAYRQDQVTDLARRYGKPAAAVLVLALALFGGYLFWNSQRESKLEQHSEELVKALDALDAGNYDTAAPALEKLLADGDDGTKASVRLLQAGMAVRQNREADAVRLYGQVRMDSDAPEAYRQLATIREVAIQFDKMDKAQVVARLKPLAVPGGPWFGSAGELLAMAYLEQGRRDLAGPLMSQIAKDEQQPASVRSRARQIAGILGVDAIEDVDKAVAEAGGADAAAAPAQ